MKKLLLCLSIPFLILAFTTQKAIDPDNLIGVWKMEKHSYFIKEAVNGKVKDIEKVCDFGIHFPILQLSKENTYSIKLKGKLIEMGAWKFKAPDTIHFFNRKDMPDDPLIVLDDRKINVIKANSSELRVKEHQCSERVAGQSIYGKVQ